MVNGNQKKKSISEFGEFGLIEHLTKNVRLKNSSSLRGIGDDAAVVNYGGKDMVVTTDLLLEGIHFNLIYTPLKHLGYKAAVVNFSDVYSMNANPRQIIVSIGISGKITIEMLESLYEGMELACERYHVDLIGGDTSSSLTGLTISITALGDADKEQLVYRDTAKPNDLICVTGNLGAAYMGLQLLEREKKLFEEDPGMQPDLSGFDYIIERQLKPEARRDIIEWFRGNDIKPTSMIDISDGLSSDLLHITNNSGTGCRIYQDKLPIDLSTESMADEFLIDPLIAVMNGGEDYELLFTASLNDHEKISANRSISIIGHMTDPKEGRLLIISEGNAVELVAQGWNNLKK